MFDTNSPNSKLSHGRRSISKPQLKIQSKNANKFSCLPCNDKSSEVMRLSGRLVVDFWINRMPLTEWLIVAIIAAMLRFIEPIKEATSLCLTSILFYVVSGTISKSLCWFRMPCCGSSGGEGQVVADDEEYYGEHHFYAWSTLDVATNKSFFEWLYWVIDHMPFDSALIASHETMSRFFFFGWVEGVSTENKQCLSLINR